MKPFLGIDRTENKKNEVYNGQEFVVARPSLALAQALEKSQGRAAETEEKAKLPKPLRIAQWICGLLAGIIFLSILRAMTGDNSVTLAKVYENVGWLIWLGAGCLVVWGVLTLLGKQKEKTVLGSDESEHTFADLDSIAASVFKEMGVPENAPEVDILSFGYKLKNGQIKPRETGMQMTPYTNFPYRIFMDANNLYLANLEEKYAIPKASMTAIRRVKKHIRVPMWNKDADLKGERYKPYKLSADQYNCVHMNWYHILEVSHQGETWGIYFPNYELPVMEAATGLKSE